MKVLILAHFYPRHTAALANCPDRTVREYGPQRVKTRSFSMLKLRLMTLILVRYGGVVVNGHRIITRGGAIERTFRSPRSLSDFLGRRTEGFYVRPAGYWHYHW